MRGGFNDTIHAMGREARVSRITIVRNLEKKHPGMVVFTRAFLIQHPDLGKRKREIEACTQIKEELIKAKVGVQVVLTSAGAYVLRSTEGMATNALKHAEEVKAVSGRRRMCWGGKKGGS